MPRSEALKAAQDKCQTAIEEMVGILRSGDEAQPDDGIVTDWATIVCTRGFNADGEGTSGYYMIFSGGDVPEHIGLGLFEIGKTLLLGLTKEERE